MPGHWPMPTPDDYLCGMHQQMIEDQRKAMKQPDKWQVLQVASDQFKVWSPKPFKILAICTALHDAELVARAMNKLDQIDTTELSHTYFDAP